MLWSAKTEGRRLNRPSCRNIRPNRHPGAETGVQALSSRRGAPDYDLRRNDGQARRSTFCRIVVWTRIGSAGIKEPEGGDRMKRTHTNGWGLIGLLLCVWSAWGSGPTTILAADLKPTEVVEAIGSAVLQGREIAAARERAINDGLSAAVAVLISRILPLESLAAHFAKLDERLLARTQGLVRNYRVLSEHSGSGTYRVLIQATIATEAIGRELADAGLMAADKQPPRVILFIVGQSASGEREKGNWNSAGAPGEAESGLIQALGAKGFAPLTWPSSLPAAQLEPLRQQDLLTDEEMLRLAGSLEADILVTAALQTQSGPPVQGSELRTVRGSLAARALRVATGTEIAATTQSAAAVQRDENAAAAETATRAGRLAGEALAAQLAASENRPVKTPARLTLLVEGTKNLGNFVQFRNALREVPGVRGMTTNELQANQASLSVDFNGDGRALATVILEKVFIAFRVEVLEMTDNQLRVALVAAN